VTSDIPASSDVPASDKAPTSSNVTILEQDGRTIYLVGTAHVSAESVQEVKDLIEQVQPDVVCVELCAPRYKALTSESAWRELDIFKVIREGKTLFLLANLAIGAYQRRIGDELGVKPGSELLAAARKAEEVGARVELIDRDIHVTLKRTWANLGFWQKNKLLAAIIESLFAREKVSAAEIEELKQQVNLSDMVAALAKELPQVKEPLIDERDQYMLSGVERAGGQKVVVVVGAAHVPGMRAHFGKPVDRARLEALPPPSRLLRALNWLFPMAILLALVYGIYDRQGGSTEDLFIAWVLPTSLMCSLLTAAAGARLLSLVTAAVASPITTLIPVIGAGMVVGLVEAWLRKPTVEDCERINQDVQTWRGIYRNPVTRVMLVAVASTMGAALGAWIGLSWVVSLVS
jgi:pheromone shutdown-related protein TraB